MKPIHTIGSSKLIKFAADLNAAKKQIISLTTVSDVAYEDYSVVIEYRRQNPNKTYTNGKIEKMLPELFKIIATEMMGVALTERGIDATLRENLFLGESHNYRFLDTQLIKKILNQLKALNLVYSSWNEAQTVIYWGLTTKGELERNKMILVRKTVKEE